MQNRLTIKDIARLSGVGKSTVSRVLNNESGVSERTRERVEAVMNQHGFSPSRSARAMRGQSDKVVAIIVTRLDSLSENLAVQTMLPAFYEQGYDPIMMESQFSVQLVEEHLGMLQRRNIDGVVLFGFTGIHEEMLTPWRETLVLLARDAPGIASVCYDDEGSIRMLMQRLYDRGHRHISFLGVPHSDITTGQRRHQAYLDFCQKKHLTPLAALPGLAMSHVEATYLAWIDARGLGVANPAQFFEEAGVGLSNGADFGLPGWVRLNFGCTRTTLEAALERMKSACLARSAKGVDD